jgi:tyrosinase
MAVRVRKSVWSLPPADKTLDWYRQAVERMISRPVSDPTSWRYQAAVHGTPPGMPLDPIGDGFWDQCQHQSWFFLPWHRGYLAAFEAVVAATVEELGGPDDWALPYWDYSEDLAVNPNARLMPPAFRDRLLPGGGGANALWSRRAASTGGNFNLDNTVVTLAALNLKEFTNPSIGSPSGFGGPPTGFNPGGGDNGALENLPHNRFHVRIGGQTGFMSDPATAALDPIFWLHHCNIDRLWEVWRNKGPDYRNPTDSQWLTDVAFDMRDGTGAPFTFTCEDMLDTTKVLHGYRYDTVPVAVEPSDTEPMDVDVAPEPALVGENDGPEQLGLGETLTVVHIEPTAIASLAEAEAPPRHAYLNLEGITGTGLPGDFAVYIDLPDDDHGAQFIGMMTTFGLERASQSDARHGGGGLTQVFDVTEVAQRLGLTQGDVADLSVRFVREALAESDQAAPAGLEEYAAPAAEARVRVGRVSLYYG